MFYDFATDLTLAETREVVRERNELLGVTAFIEADKGEYVVFNYVIQFDGAWLSFNGDPVNDRKAAILRECRGLTFYKDTGEVAIRKLHKFWNLLQNEESQPHVIDWNRPHIILSKADGSMITPYQRRSDNGIEFHTKMGRTGVAEPVNEFADANPKYAEFARYCIANGMTPVFEWCSRKQKIVIDYPEDDLVLLAVRENSTGEYLPYEKLVAYGADYGITVIGRIEGSVTDVQAFLDAVRVLVGEEGYIVRFDNGHAWKSKGDDYLRLHRMVDALQLEKSVLELVLSGSIDDMKPLMTEDSRGRVERFIEAVERGVMAYAAELDESVAKGVALVGDDKKRFATEWVNRPEVKQRDRQFLFRIGGGANSVETLMTFLKKKFIMPGPDGTWQGIGTAGKVDEVRDIIGGIRWDDFRDTSIVIED